MIGGLSSLTCGRDTARTEIRSNLCRVFARNRVELGSLDDPVERVKLVQFYAAAYCTAIKTATTRKTSRQPTP